jgi:hypothetical protein
MAPQAAYDAILLVRAKKSIGCERKINLRNALTVLLDTHGGCA